MVVEHIEAEHREGSGTYRQLCDREGVAHASFMRWRERTRAGVPTTARPGPGKVGELDFDALREEIRVLRHGRRRTAGTGELHRKYGDAISRRDLDELVREERDRKRVERNRVYRQVNWKAPRLIWAMDDTEYQPDRRYPKAFLNVVQDLGSRFKLPPIVGSRLAHGDEIAVHLARLFKDYGPPLFIKRDNGGNLNHHMVETLLGECLVIPINSPVAYPQFNGGIERAMNEIKSRLKENAEQPRSFLAIQAEIDFQAMNHRPRPVLGRRTPCAVFTAAREEARIYNRRKRKEVYDWIKEKTLELIDAEAYDGDTAWRLAVETWLLENRFISISKRK